jgi:hypothetical protein
MPADDKSTSAKSPERDKALGLVLNQIERNFGKGSIMRLGDASRMRIETTPTGARRALVRRPSPCTPSLKCSAAEA